MNPLITKGLIGLGGLSVVSGGGLLAWNQGFFTRKPETIRDKLKKEGYAVLEKTSSHWSQIFGVYKGTNNTKKFEKDGITEQSTETDHFKLKNQCEKALELESSDDAVYGKVIKWCVVPRKVEDLIAKSSLLGVITTNANDANDWKPILEEYIGTKTTSNNTYALNGVVLEEPSSTGNENVNINKLKEGCKTRREKLTYDLEFEKSLEEVKKWCVSK